MRASGHNFGRYDVRAAGAAVTLSATTRQALDTAGLDPAYVLDLVSRAVAEDLGGGVDVTSVATVPAGLRGVAAFVPRTAGTVAGTGVVMAVLDVVVPDVQHLLPAIDGMAALPGLSVLEAEGPVRELLTAERTALNLLCHLSGIATLTQSWVDAIEGTGARIRDTRKTTPG
ncbi:MAG: nicotinate-nucleotide diphosphorylase (carboxylating), partial [Actinobacteria bacterium]|nr:nicotinate-nucleotide diphosphorylase (carboxylating) [Actinomycetota bacterium]